MIVDDGTENESGKDSESSTSVLEETFFSDRLLVDEVMIGEGGRGAQSSVCHLDWTAQLAWTYERESEPRPVPRTASGIVAPTVLWQTMHGNFEITVSCAKLSDIDDKDDEEVNTEEDVSEIPSDDTGSLTVTTMPVSFDKSPIDTLTRDEASVRSECCLSPFLPPVIIAPPSISSSPSAMIDL
jgi:hypothetical protein